MFYYSRPHLIFFFNDTATPEIYTLSLHDALPIFVSRADGSYRLPVAPGRHVVFVNYVGYAPRRDTVDVDRKSTRLNSSHSQISYAVFCLKKKKKTKSKNKLMTALPPMLSELV